jgi:hypothetical protein
MAMESASKPRNKKLLVEVVSVVVAAVVLRGGAVGRARKEL